MKLIQINGLKAFSRRNKGYSTRNTYTNVQINWNTAIISPFSRTSLIILIASPLYLKKKKERKKSDVLLSDPVLIIMMVFGLPHQSACANRHNTDLSDEISYVASFLFAINRLMSADHGHHFSTEKSHSARLQKSLVLVWTQSTGLLNREVATGNVEEKRKTTSRDDTFLYKVKVPNYKTRTKS